MTLFFFKTYALFDMYEDKVTVLSLFTAFAKLCMGTKALDVEKMIQNDTEHNITVYT